MAALLVRDLMSYYPHRIGAEENALTAYSMMAREGIRHIPVTGSNGQLVGILSQRDILKKVMYPDDEVTPSSQRALMSLVAVKDIMSTPPLTVTPDTPIAEGASLLLDRKIGCLPVVEKGEVLGILTESDFVKQATKEESAMQILGEDTTSALVN